MTREHPDDPDADRSADGQPDDDAAWRAIVDNYGDRVLDDLPDTGEAEGTGGATETTETAEAEGDDVRLRRLFRPIDGRRTSSDVPRELDAATDDEGYVPPAPAPVPRPSPDRLLAWVGVFGAPAVLLFFVITGIGLPSLAGWVLVGWFLGGFGYLVATMPTEPRDPWDDGAQV